MGQSSLGDRASCDCELSSLDLSEAAKLLEFLSRASEILSERAVGEGRAEGWLWKGVEAALLASRFRSVLRRRFLEGAEIRVSD
jgi:hypothetical protein